MFTKHKQTHSADGSENMWVQWFCCFVWVNTIGGSYIFIYGKAPVSVMFPIKMWKMKNHSQIK